MPSSKPVVLVIGGLDPSGGAGLVADIQAVTALGAHPATVAAALTVQDTSNASEVSPVEAAFVAAQARAVLADMPVAAVKIGLLATAANAAAVADLLGEHPTIPVVLDPVMVASGGATLGEDTLMVTLRDALLARANLATPNRAELARLAPESDNDADRANALLAAGCENVLMTGGDDDGARVENKLFCAGGIALAREWPRLKGRFHGSGCTLASATAAKIAGGASVADAVELAQNFTYRALQRALFLGRGQAIPERAP
jgi:hydroxymethylpyrimidine/phosphomethylpyrimidine kinase